MMIALVAVLASSSPGEAQSSKRMPDGKEWTTSNLDVEIDPSYCYDDAELNCRRFGRLYTWDSARRGCESLGSGWRLPADDDWRQMAKQYGGLGNDSDGGKATYRALLLGGTSGFDILLGGGREPNGNRYARLNAHGFYWTASESDAGNAVFYNFAGGQLNLYRQGEGQKQMAVSVRCVRP